MSTPIEQIKAHLAGLKEREDAAVKGPWILSAKDTMVFPLGDEKDKKAVANCNIHYVPAHGYFEGLESVSNATFIAASRSDIPSLRAALECAVDTIEAARRLRSGGYLSWANAGGVNECKHGRSDGIPCQICDQDKLDQFESQILTILQPA